MRGICCWLSMNLWITLCTGGRDEVNMHLAAIAQRTEIQQNLAAICISGFILKAMTLKIQRIRRQWHWKSWSIFRMLLAPKILCNIGKSLRTVEQECAKEIEISANN